VTGTAVRLRVALPAGEARPRLAARVAAAGHVVLEEGALEDGGAEEADVLLTEAALTPLRSLIPVVLLGEAPDEGRWAGVLPADASPAQLDAALRAACCGLIVRAPSCPGFRAADAHSPLTAREIEILAAIGDGLTNKQTARRLGISAHTVKAHLEAIFRKLDADSRAEAVAKGLRQGFMEL